MSAKKDDKKPHHRRPWRDNIEAVTMAIVMAVMLKYFIVEAYKIPTGSMQPTLMGNEETGIFDRILVDKLSYHLRDPERFEIVVFKYPLDRSKNFIKRLCGMPGEQFRIQGGDLWTRKDASQEWKVLRKPRPVQEAQWKAFDRFDPRYQSWKGDEGAKFWVMNGRSHVEARGKGSIHLPNDGGSVVDRYLDGYPGRMGQEIARVNAQFRHLQLGGSNPVGDLRLSGTVQADASCARMTVVFREGPRSYRLEIPGPAAPSGAQARIAVSGDGLALEARASGSERLAAGKSLRFSAQNMDDLLELDFGDTHVELEIPAAPDQHSSLALEVDGPAVFDDLEGWRDIYYTSERGKTEFDIPPGKYVMLGDNTQDSADSREWSLMQFKWPATNGAFVRGNAREDYSGRDPSGNPKRVQTGEAGGPRLFFRDEWGELHTFLQGEATRGEPIEAPYVPRELIVGRAVLVFWPNWPFDGLGVWRLKWAR